MQMLSSRQFAAIATIIEYLYEHIDQQPSLEDVATYMNLSPSYIQRQFQEWVGISPKKFVQYMSLQQAKYYLMQQRSLLDTALNTGLSGTGRLHDLFIQLEGMTPGEYKQQGDGVELNYSVETSPFGDLLVVSSDKGICSVRFVDHSDNIQEIVKQYSPKAQLKITLRFGINRLHSGLDKISQNIYSRNYRLILQEHHFSYKYGRHCLLFPKDSYEPIKILLSKLENLRQSEQWLQQLAKIRLRI